MVFFALLAFLPLAYFAELGSLKAVPIAGALFGLSLLSKESAVFILLAVIAYWVFIGAGGWKTRLFSSALLTLAAVVVFIVGLQLFDSEFTTYPNFLSHLQSILSFQLGVGGGQNSWLSSITNCTLYQGLCPSDRALIPHFVYSGLPLFPILSTNCVACWSSTNPIDWLTYFPPIIFPTDLVLAPNYPLVWLSILWVPLGGWSFRKLRSTGEGRALLLAVFLFAGNMASNIYIYAALNRAVFEWYFLPAVPALAIGASYLLTRPKMPRWIAYFILIVLVFTAVILSSVTMHILFPQTQSCGEC